MNFKKLTVIVFCIFISTQLIHAQDTLINPHYRWMPKRGIYLTKQEFVNNSPSVKDSFYIVPNTTPEKFKKKFKDSLVFGFDIRFADTTKRLDTFYYGFSDGNNMYLHFEKMTSYKAEGAGKFCYLILYCCVSEYSGSRTSFYFPSQPAASLGFSTAFLLLANSASKITRGFYFENRDGELIDLKTFDVLGRFLKKDRDLYKEFEDEPKYNLNVYKKYLDKMNARYSDKTE